MAKEFETTLGLEIYLRDKRTSKSESIIGLCRNSPKFSNSFYSAVCKFENGKFPTPKRVKEMEYFNTYLDMLDIEPKEAQEIITLLPNLILSSQHLKNKRTIRQITNRPTRSINRKAIKASQELRKKPLRLDKTVLYGGPDGELKEGDYFSYNAVGVNSPGEENAFITTIFERCLCKKVKGHYVLFRGLRDYFLESSQKEAEHLRYIYPKNIGIENSLVDVVETLKEADDVLYKIAKQDAEKYANSVGIPFEDKTVRGKSS